MKQKKFNRLSAFIPVRNIHETLDYYKNTFGFYDEWTMGTDGGLRRDDMRLVFCQDEEYAQVINNDMYSFVLIWFVDKVDEIYQEFREKKIEITSDIENKPWGIREFTVRDINGYTIRISEGLQ
jgi:uncharacterized glyoxalase superfamily protein PhnB